MAELPRSLLGRAARVRRLILEAAPHAEERVTWDAISFFDPEEGGPIKGSICQLVHRKGVLRLDFPLGYLMEDPDGVLTTDKARKGKRFVVIEPTRPTLAQIRTLIRASIDAPPKPKRI